MYVHGGKTETEVRAVIEIQFRSKVDPRDIRICSKGEGHVKVLGCTRGVQQLIAVELSRTATHTLEPFKNISTFGTISFQYNSTCPTRNHSLN